SQIASGVAGDDRGDGLTADLDADLCQQPFIAYLGDLPEELVTPADRIQADRLLPPSLALIGPGQAVDLGPRNAVMAAGGLHRLDLAPIDPLLERRVTDAHQLRGFM